MTSYKKTNSNPNVGVAVGVARGGVACAITLTLTLTLGNVITNPKPNPSRSRNPNPRQWAWPNRWAWPNMQMSCQSTKCSPVIGWWPRVPMLLLLTISSQLRHVSTIGNKLVKQQYLLYMC